MAAAAEAAAAGAQRAVRPLVRRGRLKSPFRAAEKALTCYGGDVSRLLDLCRCRILVPLRILLPCGLGHICAGLAVVGSESTH